MNFLDLGLVMLWVITQLNYHLVGSDQAFSQALDRLTEPKAASALSSPLVSSVLYMSMEGVVSATTGSGRVDTEVLSDSLLDEIMKVLLCCDLIIMDGSTHQCQI